ncbi:kelch repeat and BTB domain-containing protein 8-like [Branchiostoma lanceolatum]|uniref:kelch repeat and BTB domain-containing protein 8-like n=1 Tax=Branchiostoma lanceolatum TaxID=7740 RepID=UPI0034551FCC
MAAADQETHPSAVRRRSYENESYRDGFLGTVGDLQKAGVLQDVILEVEGRQFPCHRLVLSAASPYFRAMFTNGMAESRQKTVVLKGLDADVFAEIVSYIYTGTLRVSLDKVQLLYQAADLLQLDYVRDTCSSYMVMSLARSTCVDLYAFAEAFSLYTVLCRCKEWICRHFAKFASSEEFCSLSVNQLTEIISHDELDVKEETAVWEAVVRWVQHSKEDRLHHLPRFLYHIRFNLLTSDDTTAILEHPLVREDPRTFAMMKVVKKTSDLPRRVGMDSLEMALAFSPDVKKNEVLYMNPRTGDYITCSYSLESLDDDDDESLPPNAQAITVTSNNDIYVLAEGPRDDDHLYVFEYNQIRDTWERACMSPVFNPGEIEFAVNSTFLVELDGILYYLYLESTESSALVRISKYNWHTDHWDECSQLPSIDGAYDSMTALSCSAHIYFLSNKEMHRYDPNQDSWCKRTPPRGISDVSTAVALGTEIFCANDDFVKAVVYDTESDRWQMHTGWRVPGGSADPEIVYNPHFFVLENKLHLWLEGYNEAFDMPEKSLMYVYDRSSQRSRRLNATLPVKQYMLCGHVCPVARMYLPWLKKKGTVI